jgi:molybdenum cofactor cytidylyltransferase
MFPYLMELKGSQGAKKVVDRFPDQVTLVDFPKGSLDIDTPEDYQQLIYAS